MKSFHAGTAVYDGIYRSLRGAIERGDFRAGQQLPSEHDLATTYGASRHSVRRALVGLVSLGLVETHRGHGTFVAGPRIPYGVGRRTSFSEAIRAAGLEPGMKIVVFAETLPPLAVIEALDLDPVQPVRWIERIRTAAGAPVAVTDSWIPTARLEGLTREDLIVEGSLYALAERRYGIEPVRVRSRVEAVASGDDLAELTGCSAHAPLLAVTSVVVDGRGSGPFEYCRTVFRADRVLLDIDLQPPPPDGPLLGVPAGARPSFDMHRPDDAQEDDS